MTTGKYLAIDYGQRRIGLAISDYEKEIAFPRETISSDDLSDAIGRIVKLCSEEEVSKVIIGLPLKLDGTEGDSYQKTKVFGDQLKKELGSIRIEYFDERFSTKQSIQRLQQQGIRAKNQKGQRDMIAAQVILEEYLRGYKA